MSTEMRLAVYVVKKLLVWQSSALYEQDLGADSEFEWQL